ncbi:hypothetical protein LEP1GSC161_2009 [Leptospira santarosai str. CBC1416]|uniref:Uncharacterized protein n=4 Tax=Leptospira santarosai TaxID=28183 RepID=M6UL82_9LEPT|nr:hypothetical protein LEP1GSC179_3814 [Leptospira santarosai str. MOR084]EKO78750.1 hypothetical protein LEP1GSC068_2647 [Leptospira sp. Fiocruz LV3954]EKR91166.1 hypothetical protein LEP1GSC163_3426 [Leptospira santarosai str. CBC379]EKS07059.1 hypothetical protein LEP1GSC071_1882 [Leptospira santarosai str. JET]EMI61041.1 hypothetical protein LEP1GSC076_0647 [Leptospira sp. Fiocruz LV4135]EMJ50942.1 hypothetical protein LEP1GSC169_1045 [Leptospira santarosai str. HAI1349]EMM77152.1 hypoth
MQGSSQFRQTKNFQKIIKFSIHHPRIDLGEKERKPKILGRGNL